jgi:hypothetical protein
VKAAQGERLLDALALVLLKLAVGAAVLHAGFTHVSDDDYARTVIAQQFAHTPRLDASGTSWLPAPFWIEGGAMLLFGRSLEVARAVAVALGAASVAAPYLAMRTLGMTRTAAVLATAFAMTTPWNAWLDVATVPEGWVGALVAAAMLAMPVERARPWAAAALMLGGLSRYETWPACVVLALLCVWRCAQATAREGRRGRPSRELGCALVTLAGPIAWMAWNAHAHGSPLHFVARVSTFRQSIGAASVPLADKLLGYPKALVLEMPVAAAFAVTGAIGLVVPRARQRWAWPVATSLLTLAFLVWGDVHDGAPTHHAARALVAIGWVLVAWGVDAISTLREHAGLGRTRGLVAGVAVLAMIAGAVMLVGRPPAPGQSESEDREPQLARGRDMRERRVRAATVVPCSFEHFALLAAWGAPERADVRPRTGAPPTADCPLVTEPDGQATIAP